MIDTDTCAHSELDCELNCELAKRRRKMEVLADQMREIAAGIEARLTAAEADAKELYPDPTEWLPYYAGTVAQINRTHGRTLVSWANFLDKCE